ncbi:MAG: dUTP diphosphatase [Candidatus Bathyarchaeota archaeon]|nr:MAG: dUTP diphosphatase [Candidatus Bathyarchaeota archaeon]
MELNQLFEIQRDLDRKMGWNRYERCRTHKEIVNFMEHLILVVVDELGEISRVRKKFQRDKQNLDISTLKKEMVDIFIFVMQGSMALEMNLEEEYLKRMKHNEERFLEARGT